MANTTLLDKFFAWLGQYLNLISAVPPMTLEQREAFFERLKKESKS